MFKDRIFCIHITGTRGDIHPFLGIANELKSRGAEVVFLVNDYFKNLIENSGFIHKSTGSREAYIQHYSDPRTWDHRKNPITFEWGTILKPAFIKAYSYISERFKTNNNIVIIGISHHYNGALTAGEKLGLPIVRIALAPAGLRSIEKPTAPLKWGVQDIATKKLREKQVKKIFDEGDAKYHVSEELLDINQLREERGLIQINEITDTEDSAIGRYPKNQLHIGLYPSWYGAPASDWPENFNFSGFPLTDEETPDVDKDVLQFISKYGPPVLFTGGSALFDSKEVFSVGLEACKKLNIPGLFVGGDLEQFKVDEEGHMHVKYVTFEKIFDKCKTIVHHGGIGTLAQAIRAGTPQLIRPMAYDQFDNGDRVHELGIGTFVLRENYTPDNIYLTLKELIDNPQIKSNVAFCKSLINRNSPIEKTCNLIEDYLAHDTNEYVSPLKKSVAKLTASDKVSASPKVPLIKNGLKDGDGNLESGLMVLNHHKKRPNIKELKKLYPHLVSLEQLLFIIKSNDVEARALSCEAQYLTDLNLPCLVQWQHQRFIVLTGFNEEYALVRDPLLPTQKHKLHEFAWNYSEIAVEVT